MTGFGSASGSIGARRAAVELRTVNHRFFNPSIKLPPALAPLEGDVREQLRERIGRGHVMVTIRYDGPSSPSPVIDEDRFAGYVAKLRELQQRHALGDVVDLATVLRLPDVLGTPESADGLPEGAAGELKGVVASALDALIAMRNAEGARLAAVLEARFEAVDEAVERIARRSPERLIAERDRLRTAVRELTGGMAIDEARLAQEIALLADRLDVSEELDRFQMHLAACRQALRSAAYRPAGKRLGFLVQEMVREANTTGSKSRDAAMVQDVIAVKEELDRIAEQVENVE